MGARPSHAAETSAVKQTRAFVHMYANPADAGEAKAGQSATITPDLNEQLEWLKAELSRHERLLTEAKGKVDAHVQRLTAKPERCVPERMAAERCLANSDDPRCLANSD